MYVLFVRRNVLNITFNDNVAVIKICKCSAGKKISIRLIDSVAGVSQSGDPVPINQYKRIGLDQYRQPEEKSVLKNVFCRDKSLFFSGNKYISCLSPIRYRVFATTKSR